MFNEIIARLPTPPHETISIMDSTKIKTYLECPRKFFFEYILGWRPEYQKKNHLCFGSALHKAMESLMTYGYSPEAVVIGMLEFNQIYREEFPEATDSEYYPKTPARATDALMQYIETYKEDKFRVLYTETAGTILVGEDREVHFKMDLIAEEPDNSVFFMDNKTGSRLTKSWQDQWLLSYQMNLYTHALYCIYPKRDIFGGKIQGFIFNKNETQLIRVPVRRTMNQLESWLWSFNNTLDRIEEDFIALSHVSESETIMRAFPQNPTSCGDYYGCPYLDLCSIGNQNPCANCQKPPLGFVEDRWDPRKQEEKAKTVLSL